MNAGRRRIAYVTTRYPAISHTFIDREISFLRSAGFDVMAATMRNVPATEIRSRADAEAHATTISCSPSVGHVLLAVLRTLGRHPVASFRTLFKSLTNTPSQPNLWAKRITYFGGAAVLLAQCRRRKVTHLHAHFAQGPAHIASMTAQLGNLTDREGLRWSWSLTMHGSVEFFDESVYSLPYLVRDAAYTICISDFTRSQLMRHVPPEAWDRLHVIRCGVDPTFFRPDPEIPNLAPAGSHESGPVHALCVARFDRSKAHVPLLRALASVISDGVEITLTLIGDGPERPVIEQTIKEFGLTSHVRLLGAVGQDDILQHYQRADFFCLASYNEGLPVVLMEAMAVGLPVVATAIAGIPELVRHGENGLLTVAGSEASIADALRVMASDPMLRRRMGMAARQKVTEEYDIRRNGQSVALLHESWQKGNP